MSKDNKILSKSISLVIVLCLIIVLSFVNVNAHEKMLNVKYDECEGIYNGDGENEIWYYLNFVDEDTENPPKYYYHLDQTVNTISYYFNDSAKDNSSFTWDDAGSETLGNQIKEAYANSMKKWNDVYFYSYDSNGKRTINKVINIEEATSEEQSNLVIYPAEGNTLRAKTVWMGTYNTKPSGEDNLPHLHPKKFGMHVYLSYFYTQSTEENEINIVNETRSRTGAHEIGHVLGLDDVDDRCTKYSFNPEDYTIHTDDHHEEILMGYGVEGVSKQTEITYKDIAGVSITRGFHTDSDHIWMKRTNSNGTIDLICAICNGVLLNKTLDDNNTTYEGKTVNVYGSCTNHNITSSNMLLVATNGKSFFYKC